MDCMYHRVPRDMKGTVLYPLNRLQHVHPGAYATAVAKYLPDPSRGSPDRRHLMAKLIPRLGCLWNDALHSSSVHPEALMQAWKDAGYTPREPLSMFEIPLSRLDQHVLIYVYRTWTMEMPEDEFVWYDPSVYKEYAKVPDYARLRFNVMARRPPFWLFAHIPHVLTRQPIETEGLRVITVNP